MDKDLLSNEGTIKNFTLNINIDDYHDFVNYFYKLSTHKKYEIIYICVRYIKYNKNIKNGNIDKIYNMYKILLHKLQYNKLNFKEKSIYEVITKILIYSEEFEHNKWFNKYSNDYLQNRISKISINNLFLIMQDVLNDLNKKYNKNYKIGFSNSDDIAYVSWTDKENRWKIMIGQIFIDDFKKWLKSEKSIEETISYTIFIILHEFKHLLQIDDYFINNTVGSSKYIKEVFMIDQTNGFYNKYHDNFITEKEANVFAYNYLFDYLYKYIDFNKKDVEKYIIRRFTIWPINKKGFLLIYKSIIKYIELNDKVKLKNVEDFFEQIHELKKEYKETYLEN